MPVSHEFLPSPGGGDPLRGVPSPARFTDLLAQPHAVRAGGVKPGRAQALGHHVAQIRDGRHDPHRPRSVIGHDPARTQRRVVEVRVAHLAGVQQAAQFLDELHERRDLRDLLVRALEDVPLEPGAAFERHRGAVAQVGRAPRGMRRAWADVCTDHLGRHHELGGALDVHAVARVVRIGRPDAVGVLQDPCVGAATARSTAFDLEPRELSR